MGTWLCPNENCNYKKGLKENQKCPQCGTDAKEYGIREMYNLFNQKDKPKLEAKLEAEMEKKALFTDELTDEDIKRDVRQDMMNLAMHEVGTGWDRLATIFSGSATERLMAQMLKAIVDQNKIIIRQNELNRRLLQKLAEKP